jgi:hypothetical protein
LPGKQLKIVLLRCILRSSTKLYGSDGIWIKIDEKELSIYADEENVFGRGVIDILYHHRYNPMTTVVK